MGKGTGSSVRRLRLRARHAFGALFLTAALGLALTATATAQAPATKVLVFHGAPDATVNAGVAAIQALGTANDFSVTPSQNASDFTAANLEQYRAIVFLGNAGNALSAAQETALQGFINNGGGFVGIGGAAEGEPGSTFYGNLIGARPTAGSPTATAQKVVEVGDRVHPATKTLPLEWTRDDVWYEWQTRPTGTVHTVARYRAPNAPAGDGTSIGGTDWPISWCRDFQGGRSFYTGMGRTAASFDEANFRTHLLGAIQWSAGMIRAGCKATIAANYTGERLVEAGPESTGLATSGESHGVAMAPNGWAIYIGRGDCRTDAERGAVIGQGPTPRISDFANRNVGVGCGNVHIWDPEQHNGTVNSGVTKAGVVPVYGDRGSGDEINGKIETGMLGVAVSPDFEQTGHIYLQYFPTFNPDNPIHPGLADGDQRRITKMGAGRVSRFTIDLDTKQLDLDSEVVIFQYDAQIWSCCHQGGGMGFDSEGNLYVTTGDSNSSQRTGGYSGNYQPATCPTGPNVASNDHCGPNGVSFNDARRTAGSTNDYNGKMLRFNPVDTIPDGSQPAVGPNSTYTLPTAQSPNGPNLFDGTEEGGGKTKPEIYAMGLRNPSRLFIDPETNIPYSAWVGPDAGAPSATLGPSTYENATQLPTAGNYGWPYCMGNQQAYRDRIADGNPRTTNAAGFVSGGPAASPTQGWYDCKNLVNDSTRNTGLTVLPHQTGTGKDAGTARPLNLWYSRGNPGGANGCPDFPREQGANNAPNYGANPTQLCPYLTASGATIFNGPVYRYDGDAEDQSARWPEYWDGRWFLQDFGNNSAKHGLLLDPATDQDGGKPVYADSLRGVLNWQANYMDSKFGPDGAYYVQVYSGFFTTGAQAGLYRFAYTGGPDTPNPDPQWATTGTPREIRFSLGSSGGVSYVWDFGDGSATSTERTPTHTYAAGGTFPAKLTVKYADGEELSKTFTVNVSDDATRPTTTAQTTGTNPVEVTLSATDGAGGTGVEWTEYRIDGGGWTRSDNTGSANPFVTTFTVRGQGEHTVEFRSRDRAGNVEDPPKSMAFTIAPPGGGGSSCLPQSDEFNGSALDAKWEVRRPAGGGPQVTGGSLGLPILQGDFIANDALASNTLLQDAPSGEWTVTTRLNTAAIDANGEQAGLVIWKSENPNTFSKIVAIRSGAGNYQFEHIVTQNGGVSPPIPQSITPAPGGQMPANVLLRARYDGTKVIGEFSPDDGATWTLIGQAGHAAPITAPLKVGLAAFRGSQGGGTATYDWFRVHAGSEANGPFECATACLLKSDSFDGALNTNRWGFRHPTTPATGDRAPRTENGNLVFPLGAGAIDQAETGQIAFLGQTLPEGDFTVEAKINAPGLDEDDSRTDDPYAQVGLGLFQSNDDWVGIYQTRNGDDGSTNNGTYFEVKYENEGGRTLGTRMGAGTAAQNLPTYYLRATRTGDTLNAEFSRNGTDWTDLLEQDINLAQVFDAADGPVYIGPLGMNGEIPVTYEYIRFTPDECPDACNPLSDQFEGSELDPKWELVNPHATSQPTVDGGNLKLPLVPGDLFGGRGDAQMILQQAPAGSWVATAKIAHAAVDTNGEAAGLALINSLNPNHFVKTALQFKNDTDPNTAGNQPGKWAERVVTSNGNAITIPPATVPFPNSGALNLTGDSAWVRFVHDADTGQLTTWTSTNGTTFTSFGAPISVAQYLNQPGGFRIGLFGKHDGSGDDIVNVDAFNVVAGSADPQTPGNDCGGSSCARSDEFDGTSLDTERWSFRHPTTPDSGARAPRVEGGNLVFPIGQNSVDNDRVGPIAFLGQPLPEGDFTVEAKINAPGLNTDDTGLISKFAQVGLGLYKSDGDWIGAYQTRNADVGTTETYFEVKYETNNVRQLGPRVDSGPAENHLPTYYMRVSRAGNTVTAAYSLNGTQWTDLGVSLNITEVLPGAGPIYIGALGVNGQIEATYEYIRFTPDAGCPPAGDTTPPRTTHTLDPTSPDGQGGWYKSPVEVTLNATDNDGGSGVDKTEYRFAGDEEWTAYSGPITVDDEGRHTIEYRSVDKEGNTESAKTVTFRIDPTAPTTTARLNGEAPKPSYDGPVAVDLDAGDGAGSGVRATEIRVDGGEWKPYVEEETILNSAADLQKWEQAGPGGLNWMTDEGGFARTTGGLGMPWYPVKDYGNFSLKLQWRDSSAGAAGNSGVFVRFPHPVEAVARPAAQRFPCQVGSATSDPAWVAIYCGHEIQINDAQTSEPQKTGSIYNFSPLNATQARVQPKATWVDYEVRVVGQTYTIVRNGVVLQTFENTPDKPSSRAGDPSTSDRQFTRGYIGLQNHGGGDVIDFRNIRVLPLDEGAVTGPVTVQGDGQHTVEYRSTDVAGNQEAIKSTTFTIGAADGTPPVTTHTLNPAQPGAGGTYNGPVGVKLSATDPDEPGGGGPPETHDVNAQPSSWSPDELQVTSGDVVRWNFPTTAGTVHDVWVIEPGEAPNADGRQITSGFKSPGDPPVSETLDEVGTWTWICKVHSSRASGAWEGMVGTAEVLPGGGATPGSGVDFTEYRVNTGGATGNWVQSENTAGADPFETSFTVSAPGSHVVEYRSTDNAGNQETPIKSVAFSIGAADPDAPTVRGFADPSSGAAPLRVQFSATGRDPQGGALIYDWDFGDGGGSVRQSPEHVYTEEGTFTARVTVTDSQGKSGSATLEIVVSPEGNEAPVVVASASPRSGVAPLEVEFSAQAIDPDGDSGDVLYWWDFDDGGADAFGAEAQYTYREPGSYTAVVTAIDADGAFDTAEVVIEVGDPPGNVAPEVAAAAAPRSGAAPLRVSFTSVSSDPDGDDLTTVWDFGDGQLAGGANIAHTYRTPGTYTATVTVDDGELEATDSVVITVTGAGAVQQQPLASPVSPPAVTQETGTAAPTPPSRVRTVKSLRASRAIRSGVRLKVSCEQECQARSVLRISGERVGASKRLSLDAGESATLVARLDRTVRRNLLAAMRQAGLKKVTVTAITTIATDDVTRAFPVKITLKR